MVHRFSISSQYAKTIYLINKLKKKTAYVFYFQLLYCGQFLLFCLGIVTTLVSHQELWSIPAYMESVMRLSFSAHYRGKTRQRQYSWKRKDTLNKKNVI